MPRKISSRLPAVCALALIALASSCSKSADQPVPAAAQKAASAPPAMKNPHHGLSEFKPVERYAAKFLDGADFNSNDYAGQKIIFAFFSYKHKAAAPMLAALEKLKPYEGEKLFRIFAVSIDHADGDGVKDFVAANKFTVPVLLENAALELATRLNIESETAIIGLNNKHQPAFGLKQYPFADMPGGEEQFLSMMKSSLNIAARQGAKPFLGVHPEAPDFTVTALDGQSVTLGQLRGKVVLVFFFSPRCPHCQHEIEFLKKKFYPEMHPKGLEIIALSVLPLDGDTLALTKSFAMPWPVADDHDRKVRRHYSSELGIPENFFVDKEGKVRYTTGGYSPNERGDNLYFMRARHLLGLENPPLLSDKQFNGAETCMTCHEAQYASWAVTPHAHAWETLQLKGEDFNPECVGCHSLGFDDPRGYRPAKNPQTGKTVANAPEVFQNVQCEHCHGIGGIHKSEPLAEEELRQTCLKCHTDTFSLHFDFHERLPKVRHDNAAKILQMSEEERLALLKKASKNPQDLFGSQIKYVGTSACLSCHAEVHENWKTSVHAGAFATLKKQGKEQNAECLQCHAVGYGQPGGYQEALNKPDFESVGCESCHGPGEKHVATQKKQDIRGLGADCPFCVIEQICMSCHDAKNDPDFNLVNDLEKIRGHR